MEYNFYVLFQFFRSIAIAVCMLLRRYTVSWKSDERWIRREELFQRQTKEVSWKTLRQNRVRSAHTRGAGCVESFLAT
jgi:hypothetical protein